MSQDELKEYLCDAIYNMAADGASKDEVKRAFESIAPELDLIIDQTIESLED